MPVKITIELSDQAAEGVTGLIGPEWGSSAAEVIASILNAVFRDWMIATRLREIREKMKRRR